MHACHTSAASLGRDAALGGAIHVAAGALFGGSGTAGAVALDANATLQVGLRTLDSGLGTPTSGTLILISNLNLSDGAILDYGIYGSGTNDLLIADFLDITALTAHSATINLNNPATTTGTYTLIATAAPLAATATDSFLTTINGNPLGGRTTATYEIANTTDLILDLFSRNLAGVVWDGTNTANPVLWQNNYANWKTDDGLFLNGDAVIFDDTATAPADATGARTVTVAPAGVQVSGMTVSTATYTFTGGLIASTTDNTLDTPADSTQRLDITNGAHVTLANTIDFANGLAIAATSTLVLANTGSLAPAMPVTITADGAFVIDRAANYTLANPLTGAGSLIKQNTGTLTLTANNATFGGTTSVSSGALLLNGSAGILPATTAALGGIINVATGALFGGSGTAGTINLSPNATLQIGLRTPDTGLPPPTSGTLTLTSNLNLAAGAILDYGIYGPNASDLLTIYGSLLQDTTASTINLTTATLTLTPSGTYALINVLGSAGLTDLNFATTLLNLSLNGNPFTDTDAYSFAITDNTLYLIFTTPFTGNHVLTWTGASAAATSWSAANWKTASLASVSFTQGDIINLANLDAPPPPAAATATIAIDTLTTATIAALYISGTQSYALTGTNIIADATAGTLGTLSATPAPAATGKLVLGATAPDETSAVAPAAFTGTLDLTQQNGATAATPNAFLGGVEITTGALRVSTTAQLGLATLGGPAGLRFTGTGALIVGGASSSLAYDGPANRLVIGSSTQIVSATIATEPNATFSIAHSSAPNLTSTGTNGGAISVAPGSTLVLTGMAGGLGGAFLFDSNTAASSGGAIYTASAATALIDNATFANNKAGITGATANGGALATDSGTLVVRDSVFTANIIGSATAAATNSALSGGAIGATAGVIDIANSLFATNTSYNLGGAIFTNAVGAQITVATSTFVNNTALNYGGGAIAQQIIGSNAGTLNVTAVYFGTNTASQGGAIFAAAGSLLTIASSTFENNTATNSGGATNGGGALLALSNGGTNTITAALFKNNTSLTTANGNGGAISIPNSASLLVATATFDSNHADAGGGAVYLNGVSPVVSFTAAAFADNTAGANGGAIYFNGANVTATIANAAFTTNTAGANGGAIAINANVPLAITTATFSGNTATAGGGAIAVVVNNAAFNLFLTDVSFLDNTALITNVTTSATGGGAIFLNSGTLAYNVTSTATTVFHGNTYGNATTGTTPNSIYFSNNNVRAATFAIATGGALDMLDPMAARMGANITLAITQTGGGLWNLGGANNFSMNAAGASTAVNFTVATGTLHLYRAGETSSTGYAATAGIINNTTARGSFTLAAPATLSAGGGNLINSATITLAANSNLSLDLAGAATTLADPSYSILTLTATGAGSLLTASNWTQTLNLLNLATLTSADNDIYNLITIAGNIDTLFTTTNSFATVTGLLPGYSLLIGNSGSTLQLSYLESHAPSTPNSVLAWTGAADPATGHSWLGANSANWLANATTPTPTGTTFTQGDIINLVSAPAPVTTAITVDTTTTATIAGLYVSGTQNYLITGTSITALATVGTFSGAPAATGKLILGARALDDASDILTSDLWPLTSGYTGTLTLANASNNFTGGIDILTGVLVGNADTLNTAAPASGGTTSVSSAPVTIAAPATLIFDQPVNATYTTPLTGSGALIKTNTGALTLTADNSAFGGTTSVSSGALLLNAASSSGSAGILPATTAALGGDVFVATTATFGGAGAVAGNINLSPGSALQVGLRTQDSGLSGSGSLILISNLNLSGTLTLNAGSTLLYDLYDDNQADLITAAALVRAGASTIDINSSLSGTYTLLTLTAGALDATAADNLLTTVNGFDVGSRAQASYYTDGANLNLVIHTGNAAVIWDGTNPANGSLWQDNYANWKTGDGKFLNGDSVTFDDTRTGTNLVIVAPAGVQAVDMVVSTTGIYAYTGGPITTSATLNSGLAATATGALTITGPGLVFLNNGANNFEGGIYIDSGTLRGNAQTLNVGASLATPSAITNNSALVFDQSTDATYSALITGTGSLYKLNTATLTLDNPANTYTGGITVAAGTLELLNPAPATQGPLAISSGAQLRIATATAFTVQNPVTGSGLLSFDGGPAAADLVLSSPVGGVYAAFTGTLALANSHFTLDSPSVALLHAATLELNTGNTTTVATGTQTTGNLIIAGALLDYSAAATAGVIQTATLALITGTVKAPIPADPSAIMTGASLFAQTTGTTLERLVNAATVNGSALNLSLIDQTNAPVTAIQTTPIVQDGVTVATGTYNYKLANTATTLDINYALAALTLADNQTLHLAPTPNDTAPATFAATISGNGNLSIDAATSGGAPVTLAASNDFTGTTTITSGTLIAAADNALGAPTNTLVLSSSSGGVYAAPALDLAGHTQTLATLTTAPDTILNLATGTLTITNGGTITGALAGSTAGTLNITGGTLAITTANPALAADITIAPDATAHLADTAALGSAPITLVAPTSALTLANPTSGTLANPITGAGALNFTGPAPVTIARANPAFTGHTTIAPDAAVTLTDPSALGDATTATVNGALTLTLSPSPSALQSFSPSLAGTGTLNLAAPALALTGSNTIASINALPGANILAATPHSLGDANTNLSLTDAAITLAANNTTLGHVTMHGASVLGFAPTGGTTSVSSFNTATLTSLASTNAAATLAFNTDIGANKSDTLAVATPVTGTFNIAINNTGNAPTSGTAALALVNAPAASTATFQGSGTLTFADSMNAYHYDITSANGATLNLARGAALAPTGGAIIANATAAMPLTWFAELDTLAKRLGDLHLAPREKPGMDLWLRGYAQRINVNAKDTLVPFHETQYGTEVGADYGGHPAGHDAAIYAGAFLGYGSSSRDIQNMNATGDTTSYHGGAYATIIAPDGWYADAVVKYNTFKNNFTAASNNATMNARYTTHALGASLEAGKRIALGANWSVTPSAQAAIAQIASANYTTDPTTNLSVAQTQTTTCQLRAGAQAAYRHTAQNGRLIQPYAKLNLAQQWTTGGEITVSDAPRAPYAPTIKGLRLETGLGVNWLLAKNLQLYLDYECAFAKDYTKPYGLTLGASYAW